LLTDPFIPGSFYRWMIPSFHMQEHPYQSQQRLAKICGWFDLISLNLSIAH